MYRLALLETMTLLEAVAIALTLDETAVAFEGVDLAEDTGTLLVSFVNPLNRPPLKAAMPPRRNAEPWAEEYSKQLDPR